VICFKKTSPLVPDHAVLLMSKEYYLKKYPEYRGVCVRSHSGKLGVFASVLLMFSIVLFAGCMFWLLSEASIINGKPNGGLFNPAPTTITGPRTLNQTIADLQRSGIIVAKYTKEYKGDYLNATYETFISEAANAHVVYRAKDLKGTEILLTETSGYVIQWYPE